jgi:ABC-type dipeptide/oligopeptide/nickel transport system ATPase component
MPVLLTQGLKKHYGKEPNIVRALDGVDIAVEAGEFVAVVGMSGSGKSTLLQLGGKQPVYQLLNILAKIMDRAWVKETDAILLTSNNWFLQRAGDVPQEWIDYLKNRVKTGMTLDDLALLAGGLNSEQINRTLGSYPELSSAVSLIKNNRSILKFYYSLTSAQRSRAYSTKGLSTSSLTQSQWQQAAQAFQSLRLGSDINTLMGGASIKVFNEHSNWSISLVTQDKQTIDNWINLPKPVVEKK